MLAPSLHYSAPSLLAPSSGPCWRHGRGHGSHLGAVDLGAELGANNPDAKPSLTYGPSLPFSLPLSFSLPPVTAAAPSPPVPPRRRATAPAPSAAVTARAGPTPLAVLAVLGRSLALVGRPRPLTWWRRPRARAGSPRPRPHPLRPSPPASTPRPHLRPHRPRALQRPATPDKKCKYAT